MTGANVLQPHQTFPACDDFVGQAGSLRPSGGALWARPAGLSSETAHLWLRLRCSVGQDGILRGGRRPPLFGGSRSRPRLITSLLLGLLAFSGCGRYADFTLPPLSGGDPNLTFAFEAQPEPVLSGGDAWESHDALNPSVISRPGSPALLNFYSGFDGRAWRTGLAASDDGTHWQKQGVILAPDPGTWEGSYIAANGSALWYENQFWYWYQAGSRERPRLGLARGVDTRSWRKEPKPVLEPGPYGSWDEYGVADPDVVRIEPYFYLFYLGQDRARRQRLGVARSTDGVRWEKLRTVFASNQPWDAKVVCDPTVEVNGSVIRVWFGGGDVASPDENLHGKIGLAILRPVSAIPPKDNAVRLTH